MRGNISRPFRTDNFAVLGFIGFALLTIFFLAFAFSGKFERVGKIYGEEGLGGLWEIAKNSQPISRRPTVKWETASPESEGLHTAKLELFRNGLMERNTESLVVVKGNKVVYEWYSDHTSVDKKHGVGAIVKAAIAAPVLSIAVEEGLINLDDPAWMSIPRWENEPMKSSITIRQLAAT